MKDVTLIKQVLVENCVLTPDTKLDGIVWLSNTKTDPCLGHSATHQVNVDVYKLGVPAGSMGFRPISGRGFPSCTAL